MGCDEQEETNDNVNLQGGKAWNLPEVSPVTLASLNLTKDESETISLQVEARTIC